MGGMASTAGTYMRGLNGGVTGSASGTASVGNTGLYGAAAELGATAITAIDMKDGSMSKEGGAAAGALSGAATGLAIGSAVPLIGNAVGVAAGAIIGGTAGYFKAKKAEEDAEASKKLAQWNAARSSKPNPASLDLASSQYGKTDMTIPGAKDQYLNDKFGIQDTGILGKLNTLT